MRVRFGLSQLLLLAALFPACNGDSTPSTHPVTSAPATSVTVPGGAAGVTFSWTANHETAVNSAGGGYHISCTPSGNSPTPITAEAPYTSGSQAPHQVTIPNLAKGTYTCTVTAYSTLSTAQSANLIVTVTGGST